MNIKLALNQYSKYYIALIFVCLFTVSYIILKFEWNSFDITDSSIWANQAEYVENGDPREFDFLSGYAHPGGPVIEGTIIVHKFSNFSYEESLLVTVAILGSIGIAGICILCMLLRKKNLWWIAAFGILTLNRLYEFSTPPTAVVLVFTVFLCLLTLYIYENKNKLQPIHLALWGIVAGLSIATRVDIGIFSFLIFLILIIKSVSWKKVGLIVVEAFLAFLLFNPFMWFMPIQHIKDLIHKIVYHYAEIAQIYISPKSLISISCLAFISIFLSLFFLQSKKRFGSPISPFFLSMLYLMTAGLYTIILTSHIQAERYFLPIIFIWEVFLPLFIFYLIEKINFTFLKTETNQNKMKEIVQIFIISLLYAYNIILLLYDYNIMLIIQSL